MNLIEKVKEAIEREKLISEGTRIVVGVSGGADSVALLHILHRLGFNITAAHLNHSIRGAEADADEAFVKELCKKLGVECITAKIDVPALAKEKGISLEMAAREARHEFFRSVISRGTAESLAETADLCPLTSVICLAHHADDQLETFFLRAARGSGPAGLGGMKSFQTLEKCSKPSCNDFQCLEFMTPLASNVDAVAQRPSILRGPPRSPCSGNAVGTPRLQGELILIRPMLGIRRSEIVQWLETNCVGVQGKKGAGSACWREDASNADETIPRNRVRHQILPTLGKINERAAENILRTMEILRDEEADPEKAARRRAARDWLIEHGVTPTFDAVEQFIKFSARTDGTHHLDLEGLRVVNEYGKLNVDAVSSPRFSVHMEEGVGILRGKWEASVSLAKIAGREAIIRTVKPGDRMSPYGMEGSKKLQDIFTDLKIPKARRANWPVVVCDGEIIWLPGYRIARGWELVGDAEPALHLFCD